ncbi:MAG: type II secretion system protein [Verrucomicrobia bacterium]|nr:type II secretion system protein [Verrucomicrobiota bacterium]
MSEVNDSRRQRASGFTLIELMIVVTILLVLAGLVLPAVGKPKAHAWRAVCQNNQRQLALTWVIYADDNSDWLVQNGYVRGGGEPSRSMWVQQRSFSCFQEATTTGEG